MFNFHLFGSSSHITSNSDKKSISVDGQEVIKTIDILRRERRPFLSFVIILIIFSLFSFSIYISLFSATLSLIGCLIMAESMILAWYLAHECAHNLAFSKSRLNYIVGEVLSVINGGYYFSFESFRKNHIRHHIEHIDIVGVDVNELFENLPSALKKAIIYLEGAYIPAAYPIIKYFGVMSEISERSDGRTRAFIGLFGTAAIYSLLFYANPTTLIMILMACCLRIHIVRFVDAFQHTFKHIEESAPRQTHDKNYEQSNTFSFPIAKNWKYLNWLILNFGFHNAHHAVMGCPWFNLPKIDALLTSNFGIQIGNISAYQKIDIPFLQLLRRYHEDRIYRMTAGTAGIARLSDAEFDFSMVNFTGAFTDNLLG